MSSFIQTLNDQILSELNNLGKIISSDLYSAEQRESFSLNSIERLKTYHSQLIGSLKYADSIYREQQQITMGAEDGSVILPGKDRLIWTEQKVDFTELTYAFKIKGSFNNGNASVNQIAQQLGNFLSINPGNTSKKFQDICARKMGANFYMDELTNGLKRVVNDS
jgi:hypothetical protein